MTTTHYPAKAYSDLKREQLLQTAYALEDTRDRALRKAEVLAAALKTVASALDNLGGRIYRDLRDEYDDITDRVGDEDAKLLREFNAFADDQLAVLSDPVVRAALGETGGTDADPS
jgi:hypothetical protein